MEEKKKQLKWVPLYLALDEESGTVKMKVDNKDDFPIAVGLLMRISLDTTKDLLIKEGNKNESTNNN